jgi:hypothetical protein
VQSGSWRRNDSSLYVKPVALTEDSETAVSVSKLGDRGVQDTEDGYSKVNTKCIYNLSASIQA